MNHDEKSQPYLERNWYLWVCEICCRSKLKSRGLIYKTVRSIHTKSAHAHKSRKWRTKAKLQWVMNVFQHEKQHFKVGVLHHHRILKLEKNYAKYIKSEHVFPNDRLIHQCFIFVQYFCKFYKFRGNASESLLTCYNSNIQYLFWRGHSDGLLLTKLKWLIGWNE